MVSTLSAADPLPAIARAEYPFASQFFGQPAKAGSPDTELRMHYIDEGPEAGSTEPAIVFVHGNPTWSFAWRHLIMALRGTRRCLAMDHIGMGLSDRPDDNSYDYRLENRVDDLGRLIDATCPTDDHAQIDIVAHDWGGMIASAWACRHPERVRRLVLMNTAAFPLPDGASFPWQLGMSRSGLGALLVRGLNGFCRYALRHCVERQALSAAAKAGLIAPYGSWSARRAVHRFVQDIPLNAKHPTWQLVQDTAATLQALANKPMMLCWGLSDFVFNKHFLAEWQRRFPDAKVHAWQDGGHYVFEDYRDEVVQLTAEFLNE